MDSRENWKLADELNVYQIVLLMADFDPIEFENDDVEKWHLEVRQLTSALRVAIQNAVMSTKLQAKIQRYEYENGSELNWHATLIDIEGLKEWLASKGVSNCFFIENREASFGFADKGNQFFAPKLAAAVCAWKEVAENPELLKNKTPKKALEKWLLEHAVEYGLTLNT